MPISSCSMTSLPQIEQQKDKMKMKTQTQKAKTAGIQHILLIDFIWNKLKPMK